MDVIRFQCPACSAALTVPPAAAGFRGPCPKCSVEIIGPDPSRGLAASLPDVAPPQTGAFEPFPEKPEPPSSPQEPSPELIPPTDPFAGNNQSPTDPTSASEPAPEGNEEVPPPSEQPPEPAPMKEKEAKPSDDFTPPKPKHEKIETTRDSSIPYKRSSRRYRAAIFVLSCLVCAGLAIVAGYLSGRRLPEPESPVSPSEQSEQPEQSAPEAESVRLQSSDSKTDESGDTRIAGPEATLKAFLDADGWAARSAYVMFPENIRQRMEAHSKASDDGPIETTDVSLFEITEQAHIFTVSTSKIPEGFPVAVSRDGNRWLVDWETFVEFHDDYFNRFATGEDGEKGTFHLLIKPAKDDRKDALFERFLLNPPMPGREQSAYIKKGSVALARIQGILDRQTDQNEEVFKKLLEGQGFPMILALSYKVNSEGRSYLQIEDVTAIGWSPGKP